MRVRGLKRRNLSGNIYSDVAPRAGAWIETICNNHSHGTIYVAPRAGAWIETFILSCIVISDNVAPRAGAWIETNNSGNFFPLAAGRTPCGCVD